MNLRQEIGGVKLNWRKLNSTADIKTIPFKDFSQVIKRGVISHAKNV